MCPMEEERYLLPDSMGMCVVDRKRAAGIFPAARCFFSAFIEKIEGIPEF